MICGEWSQTAPLVQDNQVHYILASDTIYTPATIRSFVSVVNQLANPSTVIWIATQRYYFGLGGGTQALRNIITEMNLPLTVEVVKTVGTEAVKRDIIRLYKQC